MAENIALTSKKGAWVSLILGLVVITIILGALSRAEAPTAIAHAPANSESTRVAELMAEFPTSDEQPVVLVVVRADSAELTSDDQERMATLLTNLGDYTGNTPMGPMVSEDNRAALLIADIAIGADNAETAEIIKALRSEVDTWDTAGLNIFVTGGPAFGADVTSSFDGADFRLLTVTIIIVALLLILTYRSPVLWLLPLLVVALADRTATVVTAALGSAFELQFDAGIISVLVFGAGTNYALLLISRYREELEQTQDHRRALTVAWRQTFPAILASNVSVVLALITLVLAVIPGTRGLGISAAAGLLIALGASLFVLPPLLAVCGRNVFWPFIPRPGNTRKHGRVWQVVASKVSRKPWISLGGGLALLAVMATGVFGTSLGLTQLEKFRVASESGEGLEILSAHFSPGEAQAMFVIANSDQASEVVNETLRIEGVERAYVIAQSSDAELSQIMVTGDYAPGTDESLTLVGELRETLRDIPDADALVGGAAAVELDAREGNMRDILVIAPLILAVSFIVLIFLLRSLLAPVLLLLVNLASSVAAIGAGASLSGIVFNREALDLQVPLLSFLFLVALGIDYTIFLVHRARNETRQHGTREAMVRAVAHTGNVITSAGVVLAGVFAALGMLPLVTLGQIGLIVGLGVLVDTLVVRAVIVPAIFSLVGDKIWWPSRGISPR